MRYDKPVFLIKKSKKEFDRTTGKYSDGEDVRTPFPALVMDLGLEDQRLLFGTVKAGSKAFLFRGRPPDFDRIEYAGKVYKPEKLTKYRHDTACLVSEVG